MTEPLRARPFFVPLRKINQLNGQKRAFIFIFPMIIGKLILISLAKLKKTS